MPKIKQGNIIHKVVSIDPREKSILSEQIQFIGMNTPPQVIRQYHEFLITTESKPKTGKATLSGFKEKPINIRILNVVEMYNLFLISADDL